MPATFTASTYTMTPRETHEGVYAVTSNFGYNGANASISDVILCFKIPAAVGGVGGVTVVDGFINGLAGADASSTWKVGLQGADTYFTQAAVSITTASNTRFTGLFPKVPSVSADSLTPYVTVIVTRTTGTSTATGSFQLTLLMQKNPT